MRWIICLKIIARRLFYYESHHLKSHNLVEDCNSCLYCKYINSLINNLVPLRVWQFYQSILCSTELLLAHPLSKNSKLKPYSAIHCTSNSKNKSHTHTQKHTHTHSPAHTLTHIITHNTVQSWALSIFFNWKKNWFFAYFIKLIWMGLGYLNRTGAEIGW